MFISFDDLFIFLFTVSGDIKEMTYDRKFVGHAHTTSVTMQMSPSPKLFPPKHNITLFLNKNKYYSFKTYSLCHNIIHQSDIKTLIRLNSGNSDNHFKFMPQWWHQTLSRWRFHAADENRWTDSSISLNIIIINNNSVLVKTIYPKVIFQYQGIILSD